MQVGWYQHQCPPWSFRHWVMPELWTSLAPHYQGEWPKRSLVNVAANGSASRMEKTVRLCQDTAVSLTQTCAGVAKLCRVGVCSPLPLAPPPALASLPPSQQFALRRVARLRTQPPFPSPRLPLLQLWPHASIGAVPACGRSPLSPCPTSRSCMSAPMPAFGFATLRPAADTVPLLLAPPPYLANLPPCGHLVMRSCARLHPPPHSPCPVSCTCKICPRPAIVWHCDTVPGCVRDPPSPCPASLSCESAPMPAFGDVTPPPAACAAPLPLSPPPGFANAAPMPAFVLRRCAQLPPATARFPLPRLPLLQICPHAGIWCYDVLPGWVRSRLPLATPRALASLPPCRHLVLRRCARAHPPPPFPLSRLPLLQMRPLRRHLASQCCARLLSAAAPLPLAPPPAPASLPPCQHWESRR